MPGSRISAPSDKLQRRFGHDPARWEEFQARYSKELAARKSPPDLRAVCSSPAENAVHRIQLGQRIALLSSNQTFDHRASLRIEVFRRSLPIERLYPASNVPGRCDQHGLLTSSFMRVLAGETRRDVLFINYQSSYAPHFMGPKPLVEASVDAHQGGKTRVRRVRKLASSNPKFTPTALAKLFTETVSGW